MTKKLATSVRYESMGLCLPRMVGMGLQDGIGFPGDVTDEERGFILLLLAVQSGDGGRAGHTGANAAQAAEEHGLRLAVFDPAEAERGFVLLPKASCCCQGLCAAAKRWLVERSFAWASVGLDGVVFVLELWFWE